LPFPSTTKEDNMDDRIIDMHAHLWMWNPGICRERILRTIECYGVSQVYVSTLESHFPTPETVEKMNFETHSFMKDYPQYIKGYVYISPEHENAMYVLQKGIEQQGMTGVKIWVSERCDEPCVFPLAEKIMEYNVPLLIHAFKKSTNQQAPKESTSVNIRNLALRYPKLKIIMAHIDGNCYYGVPNIRDLENVYVDISGTGSRAGDVEYTVKQLGGDRVLFGTDLSESSFALPYGKVLGARVTQETKEKIFYRNTLKLFDKSFVPGENND